MTLRYDDALAVLIGVARAQKIDLASDGVIVLREATGRLGLAFKKRPNFQNLSFELRKQLGPYAMVEPLLPTAIYHSLQSMQPREVAVPLDTGEFVWLRLLDRRIVGADWLLRIAPPPEGPPRLVFGSLKGGVGRTTALAVLAADLASQGKRVLCVDLDLEAPGLSSMLLRASEKDDRRPNYGVIDYLVENGVGGIDDDELFDFIGVSHFSEGSIHVLPAIGRVTDDYPENMIGKLSRALIEDVRPQGNFSLAEQLREMVDRFASRYDYDAILIDARAGLSEITAGTWLALGARKVMLFGTNQIQSFSGYRYVLSHLVQTLGVPDPSDENDWRTFFSFVHSKTMTSDQHLVFRSRLHELCAKTLYEVEDDGALGLSFNFGADERGLNIPHDATFIMHHQAFEDFAPLEKEAVLGPEIYGSPFRDFLERGRRILGLDKVNG